MLRRNGPPIGRVARRRKLRDHSTIGRSIDTLAAVGSIAAMHSVDLVLWAHREALEAEAVEELPAILRRTNPVVELVNECHWIERWVTVEIDDTRESFELRRLDLYELADRYPELDLGW